MMSFDLFLNHCLPQDRPMSSLSSMALPTSIALMCALSFGSGCSSDSAARADDSTVIVVPSSATSAPSYQGDGSIPSRRYVVRMSDGRRDWEVEFPEVATGYELRIPLNEGGKQEDIVVEGDKLTAADKQLLDALRKRNVDYEREGIYKDGKNAADPKGRNQLGNLEPGAELGKDGKPKSKAGGVDPWVGTEDKPAPTRRSYFLGLEKVKRLYRAQKYEVAVVFLKKLEQDYPNDLKIMSMMGTLWLKLGQKDLAREYWEKVLAIEPSNKAVIEAMKQLNGKTEGGDGQAPPPPAPSPVRPPAPNAPRQL